MYYTYFLHHKNGSHIVSSNNLSYIINTMNDLILFHNHFFTFNIDKQNFIVYKNKGYKDEEIIEI